MTKKLDLGICAICGAEGFVTDDHLPPRNVFPKPQPQTVNLITVPACSDCNGGSSKDDEEFKIFISLKSGMKKPHCLKLHNSAKKTLQHNRRLKRQFIQNAVKLTLPNPA